MSVKYPNYVNLTPSSEEQPNEGTPSLPPRKKSLSPPQAPSKSISSKSTHYTSSSSPCESLTPTHVAPPPKLHFVILIKQEPQELPLLQISPNDPYAQTMDNRPPGPSNPSPPPCVSRLRAGQETTAPRGGGTGGRTGRGGGRTGGRSGDQGNDKIDGQGGQAVKVAIRKTIENQNGDAINDNIRGDVRNVIENNDRRGCTYKEFLACNPKEYDGKGGAIVYTRWIEKMESVQDMSGCRDNQKVKYTIRSFVGKDLMWWNSQIHTRGREAVVGMSWEDFKTLTREEFYPSNEMQKLETELWNHVMVRAGHAANTDRFHELARLVPHLITGTLTDEALRNGSITKNPEKRGNGGEPSKDRNGRAITRGLGLEMLFLQPQTLLGGNT
ncbi:reverse transcriptase domain-containing protein [Tanacetum coccineum]